MTKISEDNMEDPITVNVTGIKWAWDIEKRELPVDKPIKFRVTSEDVNHGFGIYKNDTLLAQVQAMPGYVNMLTLKFNESGTYEIVCLEYYNFIFCFFDKIYIVCKIYFYSICSCL